MADGTITVGTVNANDGATITADIPSPISDSYVGTVNSNVAVITVPEADLVEATNVNVSLTLTDGANTDTDSVVIDISAPDAFFVLNTTLAQSSFEIREYVNGDPFDASGAVVTQITPSQQYRVRALWQDTDGNYAGSGDTINMDVDLGSEIFSGRDGTTNFNIYLYTAPATNAVLQNATFTYGKYDDASLTTSQNVSVAIPVAVSAGLSTAGLSSFLIPSTDIAEGSYGSTQWAAAVSPLSSQFWEGGGDNITTISEVNGERALGVRLDDTSSPSTRVGAGANVPSTQTYRFKQRVMFDSGFDWGGTNEGGKLGFGIAGGSAPSGGATAQNGFSSRFMWRANGELEAYVYDANTTGSGTQLSLGVFAPRGQYFNLAMEVTMNSAGGVADGVLRCWYNDDLVLTSSSREWFGTGTPEIDRFWHFTFHGGNDSTWTPSRVNHVYLTDIHHGTGTW